MKTSEINEIQEGTTLGSETLEEMHRKIVKAFLGLIILTKLHNQTAQIGGYGIRGFIHKEFNTLLSAGAIYSTLYSLERDGFITGEYTRKKKMYILTEKGKNKIGTLRFKTKNSRVDSRSLHMQPQSWGEVKLIFLQLRSDVNSLEPEWRCVYGII